MTRTTAGRIDNQHTFARIPQAQIPRSSFDRSSTYSTTMYAGLLYPVFADEMLPGDTINLRATMFGRMNTMIFPIMDNLYLNYFFFAVPLRLLWTNFKRFMGEQDNPADSISYVTPKVNSATGGFLEGGLADYMGIPTKATVGTTHTVCAFHFRAYNLIWNEWFRDENLQNSVAKNMGDGPDNISDYTVLFRGKRKDYITGSLPWPLKGGINVTLPLGTSAPVKAFTTGAQTGGLMRKASDSSAVSASGNLTNTAAGAVQTAGPINAFYDPQGSLYADLSTATAATINALRTSVAIQRQLEREARGGTRYTELVLSCFGVSSPDSRLQRPEFLGGGQVDISINAVPNTASVTSSPKPMGGLAAFGTALGSSPNIVYSATEHCVILGLVAIRAPLTYQQAENRMWQRDTKYDYYWPALSHLGEQPVYRREVYVDGTGSKAAGTGDWSTWGYQERYGEYRYKPSIVTGALRSNAAAPLDAWHLALKFTAAPTLGATFIQDFPPVDRVVATPSEPWFLFNAHFNLKHVRPMPTYGVPGLMDHF